MVKNLISNRWRVIKSVLWQKWWQKFALAIYLLPAAYDNIISWFFSKSGWPTVNELIPEWGWEYWSILGLAVLLLLTWEGIYRIHKDVPSPNLIIEHQNKTGKLPTLPAELKPLAPQLAPNQTISKDVGLLKPSAQFLRKISYKQNQVEFLFDLLDWKGIDPRDYVSGITGLPIVWSGNNPQEWARDFVSYWQKIILEERKR
ncbi:hypothetical protein ES703_110697 [subsurface metagenome]